MGTQEVNLLKSSTVENSCEEFLRIVCLRNTQWGKVKPMDLELET